MPLRPEGMMLALPSATSSKSVRRWKERCSAIECHGGFNHNHDVCRVYRVNAQATPKPNSYTIYQTIYKRQ